MITNFIKNEVSTKGNEREVEFRGLSTDTKPTTFNGKSVANGTVFIEIDTGKIFFYDLDNQTWNEV